jgi:tetratricopeptide (TPR) repeat protein
MKRMLIGLIVGLALVAAGRRLHTPADDLIAAAARAYDRGDYAAAGEGYRRAVALAGDTPALAHNHAAALYRQGQYAEAAERYRSAGGTVGRDAQAAYDRGNALFQLGCPEGESVKPQFLLEAAGQYRACLDQAGAGAVAEDARVNLELTKLLLDRAAEQSSSLASRQGEQPEDECPV